MNVLQTAPYAPLEWAVAARTLAGERESGDFHLVTATSEGALIAAIDGLGHGPEAALAAHTATYVLEKHADNPLTDLMLLCHEKLRGTRGAAMSLAFFHNEAQTMSWLGVGNVEGVLFRAPSASDARLKRESLLLRGGVVGYQLPTLRISTSNISSGDTLIFTSDGIRHYFAEHLPLESSPQEIADEILSGYAKGTDDALALVVRYGGLG